MKERVKARPRPQRNEKVRSTLVRAFVWVVLVIFVLTSVGVALVSFSPQ
jgi:hypothetical protein